MKKVYDGDASLSSGPLHFGEGEGLKSNMKYNVKIGEKEFEVEIDDINKRPIIARVEGEEFEVRPEVGNRPAVNMASASATEVMSAAAASPAGASSTVLSATTLLSPLPGTVIEIFVRPGDTVEAGTTLLIIEAMKMKNNIRSMHTGKVAQVLVSAGQMVAHKQVLVEFES
jgi:glutaconyl-CoA/methylmalonyl-CoA decarboxylase subunit gamma